VVVKTESEMIAPRRTVHKRTPTRGGEQGSKGKKGAVQYSSRAGRGVGKRKMPESGVDYISSSQITMSASTFDIGLDIELR